MRLIKKKEKPVSEDEIQIQKKTAQSWLPFEDVNSSFILRRDNEMVAVLRVEPMNITLKSDSEKKRIINLVNEAINGLSESDALQIFCLPRPVDLDSYLEKLQLQARESIAPFKKRLLQQYIQYVSTVVRGGEAIEHRYYILLSQNISKHAKEELYQHAYELAGNFEKSELKTDICDDMALLDMLFAFLQPTQAAFEPIPTGLGIATLNKEGE